MVEGDGPNRVVHVQLHRHPEAVYNVQGLLCVLASFRCTNFVDLIADPGIHE